MAICKSATERGLEKEGDRHEQKERETPDFIKALASYRLAPRPGARLISPF